MSNAFLRSEQVIYLIKSDTLDMNERLEDTCRSLNEYLEDIEVLMGILKTYMS